MASQNCVILLVDESSAMSAVMRDKLPDGTQSTKTNSDRIATSINSLLRQLSLGPRCDIALVGYRSDDQGQADVGCRWGGDAAAKEFLSSDELTGIARIEKRTRKVPRGDGSFDETPVDFPVWYAPTVGGKAPQIAAFKFCIDLVGRWTTTLGGSLPGQPLVIHVFSGTSGDGNPQMAIQELLQLQRPGGSPVVVQCHMASSSALVTAAFPSKQAFLTAGLARDLFSRASELSVAMREVLKANRAVVQPAARAIVHNAKMADLFRCLELSKCHVAGNGGPTASGNVAAPDPTAQGSAVSISPTPTDNAVTPATSTGGATGVHSGEMVGLAVLILDRSVADPFGGSLSNPCVRLQEAGNELIKQLSTKQCLGLAIDTAIISYGAGNDGQPDVRSTFEGPLSGKSVVRNAELPDNAIRVEESETEVPNGVGGLITIKKKTPIYFDVEPAGAAAPQPAFSAAASIIGDWCRQHPGGLPPIVLHLTRGEHMTAELEPAVALLADLSTSAGQTVVHHLVATESPHKSVAYPASETELEGDALRSLWACSSRLVEWESLAAAKRPYITAESRGIVVNGKFDALAEEFSNALSPQ